MQGNRPDILRKKTEKKNRIKFIPLHVLIHFLQCSFFFTVYTISNPIGSSKASAYLHKWNTQSYTVEKYVTKWVIINIIIRNVPIIGLCKLYNNPNLIGGGGHIEPYDAKISEKCLCSHHINTALRWKYPCLIPPWSWQMLKVYFWKFFVQVVLGQIVLINAWYFFAQIIRINNVCLWEPDFSSIPLND